MKENKGNAAIGKFFLRIGQVKASQPWRDEWTIPLFSLPLIMDAEGLLADEARHLVFCELSPIEGDAP